MALAHSLNRCDGWQVRWICPRQKKKTNHAGSRRGSAQVAGSGIVALLQGRPSIACGQLGRRLPRSRTATSAETAARKGPAGRIGLRGIDRGQGDKAAAIAPRARRSGRRPLEAAPRAMPASVIALGKSDERFGAPPSDCGVADGVWPGIPQERFRRCPTNLPWVDSTEHCSPWPRPSRQTRPSGSSPTLRHRPS